MRFFHIRTKEDGRDEDGRLVKRVCPKGGMTIGYIKLEEGKKLLAVFSRCSERDIWNRKRAVAICLGRFAKGKGVMEIDRPEKEDIYETLLKAAMKREEQVQTERNDRGIKAKA